MCLILIIYLKKCEKRMPTPIVSGYLSYALIYNDTSFGTICFGGFFIGGHRSPELKVGRK